MSHLAKGDLTAEMCFGQKKKNFLNTYLEYYYYFICSVNKIVIHKKLWSKNQDKWLKLPYKIKLIIY